MEYRIEKDSLGEMRVPADALYAAQTQRAVENFPISDLRFPRGFIAAMGMIKKAAARTNAELGLLDEARAAAIVEAAQEVIEGEHDPHFPIDIFQTGSGTSTNMNANEVIATLASRRLGDEVHPNDHVNNGQSSNDTIPTAMQLAATVAMAQELIPSLEALKAALERKAREFDGLVKSGRTHLMDATPVRLGQEFAGFASQIEHGIRRVREAMADMRELPLGGTAVGTGINTHPEFAARTIARLADATGLDFVEASNHFERQATRDTVVFAHGALNTLAVSLMKIANDIRWLGSGPRAGLAEITLPSTQPGSSIMPGKVNPVIPEAVTMVAAQVMGNHTTITGGGNRGLLRAEPHDAGHGLGAPAVHPDPRQCVAGSGGQVRGRDHGERGADQGAARGQPLARHRTGAPHRLRRSGRARERGVQGRKDGAGAGAGEGRPARRRAGSGAGRPVHDGTGDPGIMTAADGAVGVR